jgi:xylulokinase
MGTLGIGERELSRDRPRHLLGQGGADRRRGSSPRLGAAHRRAAPGWSEQDPEAWWQATVEAAIAAEAPARRLRGIGLSGQMHGAVCLDADDAVIRPAILWNDGRASAECAEIEAACPRSREIAGNIAMPGFTAPKLQWMRNHEPTHLRAGRDGAAAEGLAAAPADRAPRLGDVGRLRHALARCRARDWSDDAARGDGPQRAQMPRLVEGSAPSGTLGPSLRPLGLPGRCRWRAAAATTRRRPAARAWCARHGLRLARHLGRALRVQRRLLAEHRGRGPCLRPRAARDLAPDGGDPVGGRQPRMARALTGRSGCGELAAASALGAAVGGDLPALSLGRAHAAQRPGARGSFTGLGQSHGAADLAQAVMEGVAYAFADCQDALGATPAPISRGRSPSAAARGRRPGCGSSRASSTGRSTCRRCEVGAALGAARLAICAAEGADPLAVCTGAGDRADIEPDPAPGAAYAEGSRATGALHPAIREARHELLRAGIDPVPSRGRTATTRSPTASTTRPGGARQDDGGPSAGSPSATGTPSPGRATTRSAARPSSGPWFGDTCGMRG